MRSRTILPALSAALFLAVVACSESITAHAANCPAPGLVHDGSFFLVDGPALSSEAGLQAGTALRDRGCEDVFVTVQDSVAPAAPQAWTEGDAMGIPAGTRFYARAAAEGEDDLVANVGGEWVRLTRHSPVRR
jgi:hypothetical protein